MFVEFEEMPDHSRIWIYQSDRTITDIESRVIEEHSKTFLSNWAAHGEGLKSSAAVIDSRFLILCVDERAALASGCSIDASVHFVQDLGRKLSIDFFDRTQVAFESNNQLQIEPISSLNTLIASGKITPDTLVRDNLVPDKSAFNERWITPASTTWINRYFKKQEA